MKTYCKGLDICNRDLITQSIWECIKGKLHRRDTLELLSSFTKYTPKSINADDAPYHFLRASHC